MVRPPHGTKVDGETDRLAVMAKDVVDSRVGHEPSDREFGFESVGAPPTFRMAACRPSSAVVPPPRNVRLLTWAAVSRRNRHLLSSASGIGWLALSHVRWGCWGLWRDWSGAPIDSGADPPIALSYRTRGAKYRAARKTSKGRTKW